MTNLLATPCGNIICGIRDCNKRANIKVWQHISVKNLASDMEIYLCHNHSVFLAQEAYKDLCNSMSKD